MIRPRREDFIKKAQRDHIVSVFKEIRADRLTPIDAFYALDSVYLLESASAGSFGRWSFLGCTRVALFEARGTSIYIQDENSKRNFISEDPLRALGELIRSRHWSSDIDFLPFPGGAVGYLGFDIIRQWEKLPKNPRQSDPKTADAKFIFTKYNLAFDNLTHSLFIINNCKISEDPDSDYVTAIKDIEGIEQKLSHIDSERGLKNSRVIIDEVHENVSKEDFCKSVNKIKKMIIDGEALQVVLSRYVEAGFDGNPRDLYRSLRSVNPSPYLFYIDTDEEILLGASPELMVKLESKKVILRPIAGTRKRGKSKQDDEELAANLLADEKEKAEHLMLIDLARNDLGKIAQPGSVKVDRMMDVEYFSHVMHIVSEVSATIGNNIDIFDIIKAVFPAGTVTGAPKIRAIKIIDEIEKDGRGPYGGLVGYFSYSGGFDSCITIRSALIKNNRIRIQSGAGIVYDSVPEKEFEETKQKAEAMITALKQA